MIVALLAYSTHHESPKVQGVSEWHACQRPLGVWNAIWVVREAMTCLLAYWQWQRERDVRLKYASTLLSIIATSDGFIRQERTRTADTEASTAETSNAGWDITLGTTTTSRSTPLRRQPTTQELLAQLPRTPLYNRFVAFAHSFVATPLIRVILCDFLQPIDADVRSDARLVPHCTHP